MTKVNKSSSVPVSAPIQNAAELTEYAVIARYPGDDEPCNEADFEQARRWAEVVVRWSGK